MPQTMTAQEVEVLELIDNSLILYLDLAPAAVASMLWKDESTVRDFGRVLALRYIGKAIEAKRRKPRPKPEYASLFPGLDHLPQRIVTPERKRPLLAKATATQIREYIKALNRKHRERIEELQAVLDHMGPYITHNRGITVAEVARLEEERVIPGRRQSEARLPYMDA